MKGHAGLLGDLIELGEFWLLRVYCCRCRQAITKDSIEGKAAEAVCSPDVEMAVMKRSNNSEAVDGTPVSPPENCAVVKRPDANAQCCATSAAPSPAGQAQPQEAV